MASSGSPNFNIRNIKGYALQHLVWDLDPVFFSVGPLTVHWYGVLFAAAILSGLQVMKWIFQTEKQDITALDNLLV